MALVNVINKENVHAFSTFNIKQLYKAFKRLNFKEETARSQAYVFTITIPTTLLLNKE